MSPDSFMGKLRNRTDGILAFDLPTDAQWEWACRAGTSGALNDGTKNLVNSTSDPNLDLLGRYAANGGTLPSGITEALATEKNGSAIVGSYRPNAWGLYDMHGNVYEWCLDWFVEAISGGEDPTGPASGSDRVRRGGGWNDSAAHARSASRLGIPPASRYAFVGFRVAAAPVVSQQ